MKHTILTLLLLIMISFTRAQENEKEIRNVVNALFNSMRSADQKGISGVFYENATLKSIIHDSTGATVIRDEKVSEFAISVGKLQKGYVDERIIFETIRIDGDLAFVWAPYELYLNGKFNHCGVDAFTLVKQLGMWKINSLIDTRRKVGCNKD